MHGGDSSFSSTSAVLSQVVQTSIFTTQTPTNTYSGAFEPGVRFESSLAGAITGVRYFRMAGETGTHTRHLWSATGMLLGTVTFSIESASGWQSASFATPIAISANTVYVAWVNSNTAFGATLQGLASSVSNGSLSTVVGNNYLCGRDLGFRERS